MQIKFCEDAIYIIKAYQGRFCLPVLVSAQSYKCLKTNVYQFNSIGQNCSKMDSNIKDSCYSEEILNINGSDYL